MTESDQSPVDPAEAELRAQLATLPNDPETLRALAVHCAQHGRFDEAVPLIEQAVAAQPNDIRLRLVAAGIHANAGNLDAAQKGYDLALTLQPGLIPALIGLAQLAEAREQYPRAEKLYRDALESEADHVDALIGLGRTQLAQERTEQAVQIFGRATQLYPQHARALANYGQALLLRGTPQVAARPLIRALELDDQLVEARLLLGHAELGRGNAPAAEAAYRQVLQQVPSIVALAGLADAMRAQGRFAEALDAYKAAVDSLPDSEGLVASHALCLARLGRVGEAVEELRAFIAAHPASDAPRALLASIYDNSGHVDDSLSLWRDSIARDPQDHRAHAELALRLEAQGDLDAAATASDGSDGDNRPDVRLLRSRVAIRRGDYARAQRELLATDPRALPPGLARDRYRLLGLVHDHNNRHAEATLAFREAQRVEAGVLPTVADPTQVAQALAPLDNEPGLPNPRFPAPVLLLGLPGSGVERVAALLGDSAGVALREDRFNGQLDLFGDGDEPWALMNTPVAQLEVQAKRYARGVERVFGGMPPVLVDWIPTFDARILALARRALPGLRVIVVDVDPEQAFLDWLAFGYQKSYRIAEPVDAARWWKAAQGQIELLAARVPTVRVNADALLAAPATAGQALAAFLGVEKLTLGTRTLLRMAAPGGLPTRFAPERVAAYRGALAEAFAALK